MGMPKCKLDVNLVWNYRKRQKEEISKRPANL